MRQNNPAKKLWFLFLFFCAALLVINSVFLQQKINPVIFLIFILSYIFIFSFLLRSFSEKVLLVQSGTEHSQEQINITNVEINKSKLISSALESNIALYDNLKKVIEDLNRSLKSNTVIQVLSSTVYSLIAHNSGTVLFYLVDNQYQKLALVHSIKDESDLVILSKEGDIFDQWVLRHSNQLIIEDLKNDFRFDLDAIRSQDLRPVLSLISSPLISHNSLLGLLRLENKESGFFNQNDLRFLASVADLGAVALENSLLFQKKQDLAIHDDLTGLFTRNYFIGRLKDEAKRCQRLDQHLSLMMIDIDFFKKYNDQFGHTAGDIVLKRIGILLKDFLSQQDSLLCRFGGEEFLVMLSGQNSQKSFNLAESLRKKIEKENIILRRQNTHITVSIGIASLPVDTKDEDELVQKADKAMYQAKEKGRNQVCLI